MTDYVGFTNIPDMLAQVGVPVTLDEVTYVNGLYRIVGEEDMASPSGASLVGVAATVLVQTGSLSALPPHPEGNQISVNGKWYTIRASLPVEDGACTRYLLIEVL